MLNRTHIEIKKHNQNQMKKHFRHRHHKSTKRIKHPQSVIHINIRPQDTVSVTANTSADRHNNLNTNSSKIDARDHGNVLQTESNIESFVESSKNQTYSDNIISKPFHQNYRSLSPSSENTSARTYRNKVSPQQEDKLSVKTLDNQQISSDKFGSIKDHHRNRNQQKNKKYLRICVIASILVTVVLSIVLITLLTVFLTKSKTTKQMPTATNITLRWRQTADTVAGVTGQSTAASNQLFNPFGLTIDYNYTLYIGDCVNNRIQRWQRGASTGTTVCGQASGIAGGTASDLRSPAGVTVDSNSNIYIGDGANARVQFWSAGATSGMTIAGNGTVGNSNGQLNNPYGISLDSNSGTLYVADFGNHRIMSYPSGASTGTMVAGTGTAGASITNLIYPTAVHFDSPSNSLVIANYGGNNVVRWTLGANNWTLIGGGMNGSTGSTSALLAGPVGLTLDPMGNVYVADMTNTRIQLFLVGQSNAITIAGSTGVYGANSTLINRPYWVALDNQLNLYVSDTFNHRIQRFSRY